MRALAVVVLLAGCLAGAPAPPAPPPGADFGPLAFADCFLQSALLPGPAERVELPEGFAPQAHPTAPGHVAVVAFGGTCARAEGEGVPAARTGVAGLGWRVVPPPDLAGDASAVYGAWTATGRAGEALAAWGVGGAGTVNVRLLLGAPGNGATEVEVDGGPTGFHLRTVTDPAGARADAGGVERVFWTRPDGALAAVEVRREAAPAVPAAATWTHRAGASPFDAPSVAGEGAHVAWEAAAFVVAPLNLSAAP